MTEIQRQKIIAGSNWRFVMHSQHCFHQFNRCGPDLWVQAQALEPKISLGLTHTIDHIIYASPTGPTIAYLHLDCNYCRNRQGDLPDSQQLPDSWPSPTPHPAATAGRTDLVSLIACLRVHLANSVTLPIYRTVGATQNALLFQPHPKHFWMPTTTTSLPRTNHPLHPGTLKQLREAH